MFMKQEIRSASPVKGGLRYDGIKRSDWKVHHCDSLTLNFIILSHEQIVSILKGYTSRLVKFRFFLQ